MLVPHARDPCDLTYRAVRITLPPMRWSDWWRDYKAEWRDVLYLAFWCSVIYYICDTLLT
jgi:hypothetical protein